MSDEPKFERDAPDPLSDRINTGFGTDSRKDAAPVSSYVPAPLVPAQPQFTSRREARDALGPKKTSRRVSPRSAATAPAARTAKLSRRDQAAVKKLAATPAIVAAPVAPAQRKKQNPVKVMFVLLVIAGFVGGVALPAAASGSSLSSGAGIATSYKHAQSVKVSASIETSKVTRDSVSATSESELRTEQINARALSSVVGVRQPGDDYPWRLAGSGLSPLSYYYRQCVDFVAWRLNRDAGVTSAPWKWTWSNLTPWGGDASQWKAAWIRHGWKVSSTPVVGSVAWFVGDHVAYVHTVSGSNVTIEEYNGTASRAYAMRTIPISSVGAFLYPPP